MKNIMRLINH